MIVVPGIFVLGPSQRHKEVSNHHTHNKIDSPADNLTWIQTKSSNSHIVKKERAYTSKSKRDPIPIQYKDKGIPYTCQVAHVCSYLE